MRPGDSGWGRRRLGRAIVIGLVATAVCLQFIRPTIAGSVSAAGSGLEADQEVPDDVRTILNHSCGDCHSNQCELPWYGRVAPVSWYISRHVDKGRAKLNFSDWSLKRDASGKVVHSVDDLQNICDVISKNTMPIWAYTLVHPTSRVSAADREKVCGWSDKLSAAH